MDSFRNGSETGLYPVVVEVRILSSPLGKPIKEKGGKKMELPKSITKLYVTGMPLTLNTVGFVCGKQNVYVNHITKITKNSGIIDVRYDKDKELDKLLKNKDFRMKRIFKSMWIKKDDENKKFKTKDGKEMTVLANFIFSTGANLLGLLNGKKAVIAVGSNKRHLKKLFVDTMMKMRDEKKFDMMFDPKGSNVSFYIKRIENAEKRVYLITWAEGKYFTN